MNYHFDKIINRKNTGSSKWQQINDLIKDPDDSIVPLSIADMEFETAPEIKEGLKSYIDETVLGYTDATDNYYDSIVAWMKKRHNFNIEKEWIIYSPGVVPALSEMVLRFTNPNENVLMLTPVYYPFYSSVTDNGRNVLQSELLLIGNNYYIDYQDLEEKASKTETTLMILSSPHNPIGRIWSKDELEKICDICLRNNVFLISDEIHFDLIMPGYTHVSIGNLDKKYVDNCAICTSPSKTFNLAGMQTSNIIIANEHFRNLISNKRGYYCLNILGYKACELAYNKCDKWLDQLITYLDDNRKFVEDFFKKYFPEVIVHRLQGTYLMWLDFRSWNLNYKDLESFMINDAQIIFDEGYLFGDGGKGFERMNIACPKKVLEGALNRLLSARKSGNF